MTKRSGGLIGMVACLLIQATHARGEEVRYVEGFEGDDSPVEFWTRGPHGEYKVNHAGLTTRRARSGKKSFLLDITFIKDGNFSYWGGPVLRIPTVDGMKMSGHIYLEQVPRNVSVGLGHSFFVPAYKRLHPETPGTGMCLPIREFGGAQKGKWIRQEADLKLAGSAISVAVLKEPTPGVRLDKWYIHITCRAAKDARLVLYVDDVAVTGTVPDHWEQLTESALNDWENERRARQRLSDREYEETLAPIRAEIQRVVGSIPGDDALATAPATLWRGYARALLEEIRKKGDELARRAALGRKRGERDAAKTARDLVDTGIRPMTFAIANVGRLAGREDPLLIFVRDNPISNHQILPARHIIDGPIADEISIFACPGEYEPAAFVLVPSKDTTVTFQLGDLAAGDRVIGRDSLDLRVVKAWYQAGIEINEISKRLLTPELLLNDDDLVKVDHENKTNVVRDIDAPRDAPDLLPVRIDQGKAKQFWLTVRVPDDAPPGDYRGKITIRADGLERRDLTLRLRVLPFALEEPYLDYGLYYRAYLGPKQPQYVSSELKTPQQLEAELRNMKAHGVTWPNVYQKADVRKDGTLDLTYLDRYLDIKKRAGLPIDPMCYLGIGTGSAASDEEIAKRLDLLKQVMAFARKKGIREVYFYGSDEARGEALKRQRKMWKAVHKIGGKVFVACSTGFFDLVGDLLDLPIVAKQSPDDVPRVHALGRKIYNYSKPQAGLEQPYTYRYYFGHWLVRSGMDGSNTYAYQHGSGPGEMMGRPWDDFDSKIYRVLAFTYPTVDGVVDTIQWEGVREAIDDVRYLTTLQKAIRTAKESGIPAAEKLATESAQWLTRLDIEGDLQQIRRGIAEKIIQLQARAK